MFKNQQFVVKNLAELKKLANFILSFLKPNLFLLLQGDLGVGKRVDNVPYCGYGFRNYKNSLNLKHGDKMFHLLEGLGIYKLIHL